MEENNRVRHLPASLFLVQVAHRVVVLGLMFCKRLRSLFLPATALALICLSPASGEVTTAPRYNVLFLAVDDLRPEFGAYGATHVKSPHMDALAQRGMTFTRAYCQQAVCAPSRASIMTGRRPDATGVFDLDTHFRVRIPEAVTLSQHFRENGYHALSFGKIYHPGLDDEKSWSEAGWHSSRPAWGTSATLEAIRDEVRRRKPGKKGNGGDQSDGVATTATAANSSAQVKWRPGKKDVRGPAWEMAEFPEEQLVDGETAEKAVAALERLKQDQKPFFLAVGFQKPHLPFVAPRKYYDLYPREQIKAAHNRFPPEAAPRFAAPDFAELRSYAGMPNSGPLSDDQAIDLTRAYYASISYVDAQIGKVLTELDRLGLRESTVVVLWGDHGWHLGEHAHWCKHTNFEVAVRSPLLVAAPGLSTAGRKSSALVEFVDVYPTLVELCGLPPPEKVDGTSLVPLLQNPDQPGKAAAFSQYPREKNSVMGYSMRTDRYRYTEWLKWDLEKGVTAPGPVAVELYDHKRDPEENTNLALRTENAELTATLSRALRSILPPPAAEPGTTATLSSTAATTGTR